MSISRARVSCRRCYKLANSMVRTYEIDGYIFDARTQTMQALEAAVTSSSYGLDIGNIITIALITCDGCSRESPKIHDLTKELMENIRNIYKISN